MIYEQCPAVAPNCPRVIHCVMFKGHKPLNREMKHNYGGLGPFTPGRDPADYIESKDTHLPWWRR